MNCVPPKGITYPASDPTPPNMTSTPALNPKSRPLQRQPKRRLREIFPPGVKSKSKCNGSHYSLTTQHLYDVLHAEDDEQHAKQHVVKSAWFGKQTKSARHEFIVIHVEDLAIPGLKNYLAIDRNHDDPKNTARAFSSPKAKDTFRVAYDGDMTQLLRESDLSPHLVLERLSFRPDEPLLLRDLVALVHHVSTQHDTYSPVDTNCYWFTGLIWECIRKMFPNAEHQVMVPGKKGRISYIRFVPNPIQVQNVLRAVRSGAEQSNPESLSLNVSVLSLGRVGLLTSTYA